MNDIPADMPQPHTSTSSEGAPVVALEGDVLPAETFAQPTPESGSETSFDETIAELVNELKLAHQARDEALDTALRAQAELQNFRRRKERESAERIAQANGRLILDLLPVIDDFDLAFKNVPAELQNDAPAWVAGFELIQRKLQGLLDREGVTVIDASGHFDPNCHEAITVEPSVSVPSGHIIAEVRRGYRLGERILRPSFVRVAR